MKDKESKRPVGPKRMVGLGSRSGKRREVVPGFDLALRLLAGRPPAPLARASPHRGPAGPYGVRPRAHHTAGGLGPDRGHALPRAELGRVEESVRLPHSVS